MTSGTRGSTVSRNITSPPILADRLTPAPVAAASSAIGRRATTRSRCSGVTREPSPSRLAPRRYRVPSRLTAPTSISCLSSRCTVGCGIPVASARSMSRAGSSAATSSNRSNAVAMMLRPSFGMRGSTMPASRSGIVSNRFTARLNPAHRPTPNLPTIGEAGVLDFRLFIQNRQRPSPAGSSHARPAHHRGRHHHTAVAALIKRSIAFPPTACPNSRGQAPPLKVRHESETRDGVAARAAWQRRVRRRTGRLRTSCTPRATGWVGGTTIDDDGNKRWVTAPR